MPTNVRSYLSPKAILLWVAVMLLPVGYTFAQITYPTFVGGANTYLELNGSPSFTVGPDGNIWVAYSDVLHSGYLTVASSSNGTTFTRHTSTITMLSDPTICSCGGKLLVAYAAAGYTAVQVTDVTGGTFTPLTTYTTPGGVYDYRPALTAATGGTLYLAWEGKAYDPNSGEFDGSWINVAISTDGQTFTATNEGYGPPVSTAYSAGSGVAMFNLNGNLLLTYLNAANGYPQFFSTTTPNSQVFTDTTGAGGAGGHYAGDPALVYYQGVLYPMFRSAFSENNLWALATTDGTHFATSHEYSSQVLTNSPGLVVGNNGVLYQGGRSNEPQYGPFLGVSYTQ